MQHHLRAPSVVTALALVALAGAPALAVDVTVDSGQTWLGYMNVFETAANGGAFAFGGPWGTPDLAASFTGDVLTLTPNTNCYNANDAFWVNPDGSGNKFMSANMYVESLALVGETVNFSGKTLVNSFVSGYTSRAFIKVLDPAQGYATIAEIYSPLAGGTDFAFSLNVPNIPGVLTQYGFVTEGLVANPQTVSDLGFAQVAPIPAPASAALLAAGFLASRRRRA